MTCMLREKIRGWMYTTVCLVSTIIYYIQDIDEGRERRKGRHKKGGAHLLHVLADIWIVLEQHSIVIQPQ